MIYFLDETPEIAIRRLMGYDVNPAFGEAIILLTVAKSRPGNAHMVVQWAVRSTDNYQWLLDYIETARLRLIGLGFITIVKEYEKILEDLKNIPEDIPEIGLTGFPMTRENTERNADVIEFYNDEYSRIRKINYKQKTEEVL